MKQENKNNTHKQTNKQEKIQQTKDEQNKTDNLSLVGNEGVERLDDENKEKSAPTNIHDIAELIKLFKKPAVEAVLVSCSVIGGALLVTNPLIEFITHFTEQSSAAMQVIEPTSAIDKVVSKAPTNQQNIVSRYIEQAIGLFLLLMSSLGLLSRSKQQNAFVINELERIQDFELKKIELENRFKLAYHRGNHDFNKSVMEWNHKDNSLEVQVDIKQLESRTEITNKAQDGLSTDGANGLAKSKSRKNSYEFAE